MNKAVLHRIACVSLIPRNEWTSKRVLWALKQLFDYNYGSTSSKNDFETVHHCVYLSQYVAILDFITNVYK